MAKLLFTFHFKACQSKRTLRYPHYPPQVRSGSKVGHPLMDSQRSNFVNFLKMAVCLDPERDPFQRTRQ